MGDQIDQENQIDNSTSLWGKLKNAYNSAVLATTDAIELWHNDPRRAAIMTGQGVENAASSILALPGYAFDAGTEIGDLINHHILGEPEDYGLTKQDEFGVGAGHKMTEMIGDGINTLQQWIGASEESALAVPKNELEASTQSVGEGAVLLGTVAAAPLVGVARKSGVVLDEVAAASTKTAAQKSAGTVARETGEASAKTAAKETTEAVANTATKQQKTWYSSSVGARIHDAFHGRAVKAMNAGNPVMAAAFEAIPFSMRAVRMGLVSIAAYVAADAAFGHKLSHGLGDTTRAFANSIREDFPEKAEAIEKAIPDIAAAGFSIAEMPFNSVKAYLSGATGLDDKDSALSSLAYAVTGSPVQAYLAANGIEITSEQIIDLYKQADEQENPDQFLINKLRTEYHVSDKILHGIGGYESPLILANAIQDALGEDHKMEPGALVNLIENAQAADNKTERDAFIIAGIKSSTGLTDEEVADVLASARKVPAEELLGKATGMAQQFKDKAEDKLDTWAHAFDSQDNLTKMFVNVMHMPEWIAAPIAGLIMVVKSIIDAVGSLFGNDTDVQTADPNRRVNPLAQAMGMEPQGQVLAPVGPAPAPSP